jgi:lambda repressor-like predicted transcriptional regulator
MKTEHIPNGWTMIEAGFEAGRPLSRYPLNRVVKRSYPSTAKLLAIALMLVGVGLAIAGALL